MIRMTNNSRISATSEAVRNTDKIMILSNILLLYDETANYFGE